MNDPGLDEPISKVADRIEDEKDEEREAEEEDEQTFLDPRCVFFLGCITVDRC